MVSILPTASLMPRQGSLSNGAPLYWLTAESTSLLRIDIITEAGSVYQPVYLCAAAAARLHTMASTGRTVADVAEWLDYRGIVLESHSDVLATTTTVYALRKYADEFLPLLAELRATPAFPADEFALYCRRRKQEMLTAMQQSRDVARKLFYEALFSRSHPLGDYAMPDDVDRLELSEVECFFHRRYHEGSAPTVVLSGQVDEALLHRVDECLGQWQYGQANRLSLSAPQYIEATRRTQPVEGAVQTTIRCGRVLPLSWDSLDYARFMLLTTLLGGYFGSRLMSNLREDKGYTYGIYARTQIYRGCIVFYIVTDVAQGTARQAEEEICNELLRLQHESIGDEELQMVKTVLAGDFIRSIDGIFERAERLCSMLQTDITEQLTDNMRLAIQETTASQLQELAQRLLSPSDMTFVQAGVC